MRIIIFNVEHGFCAFVRSPNGHALMVDCGRTNAFSPVEFILKHEKANIVPFESFDLAHLIITHPHNDHVEDIENLVTKFPPKLLSRTSGFNWSELKDPGGDYENLDTYSNWQMNYATPAVSLPDWGMKVFTDVSLSIEEAKAISEVDFVNNTSVPVIIECDGLKIVFSGDLMQSGWEALLKKDNFRQQLAGATIFVASHHGHTSGFSTEAYGAMGVPLINVVSAHHRDASVDSRYSAEAFAKGIDFGGDTRRMFSTRSDGAIVISRNHEVGWFIWTSESENGGKLYAKP